jgi:hypothetical protein
MNKQIVACVLTFLIASLANASDGIAGKLKIFDTLGGPKIELLNKYVAPPFAATADFFCNSYDLFRSTCVNSTVLGKCPELMQGFVKNNFGVLTTITGGILASGLVWKLNQRRYASKYCNGTDDYRLQETHKLVPHVSRKLRAIATNRKAIDRLRGQGTELIEFSVKSSMFGPEVLKGVVSNVRGSLLVSITNRLTTGSAVYNIPNQTDVSTALGVFGENLNNDQNLALRAARTFACDSDVDYDVAEHLGSLEFTSQRWRQTVNNFLVIASSLTPIFNKTNTKNLEEIKQEIKSLSTPLIGLSLDGDDTKISLCLFDKVSGRDIYFALHSAGDLSALDRLKKYWGPSSPMPNALASIMRDYTLHTPFAKDKERNVRFTMVYQINVSQDRAEVITADKIRREWALLVNGGDNHGKLVWPLLSNVSLNRYALCSVLDAFLRTDSICKAFSGSRSYVVCINYQPVQVTPPEQASVGLKIEACSNNISGLATVNDIADRVITIIVNGTQVKCRLTAQENLYAMQQLANETLREQIIVALAEANDWHSKDRTMGNEFELRLREENGRMYYQILDERGVLCWQTPSLSIASSSNAGQSSQPSSSTEHTGAGKRIGLDFYYSSAQRFDANQTRQPSSSNNGASSSSDVEQPKKLSSKDMLEWLHAQPQFKRSTSPEVKQHDVLGLKRVNSMNDMNDINQPINFDGLNNPFKDLIENYFPDEEPGLPDGSASSGQTAENNSDGSFELFGGDNVDDDGDDY